MLNTKAESKQDSLINLRYRELACAVIKQAYYDYLNDIKKLKKCEFIINNDIDTEKIVKAKNRLHWIKKDIRDIEKFFKNGSLVRFLDVDSDTIYNKLLKEASLI